MPFARMWWSFTMIIIWTVFYHDNTERRPVHNCFIIINGAIVIIMAITTICVKAADCCLKRTQVACNLDVNCSVSVCICLLRYLYHNVLKWCHYRKLCHCHNNLCQSCGMLFDTNTGRAIAMIVNCSVSLCICNSAY